MSFTAACNRYWRRFVMDRHEDHGWLQYSWLVYLCFLFIPLVESHPDLSWLWPTLISLPIFLILYFSQDRTMPRSSLVQPILMAALGLLLIPFNGYGNTYLIFATAFAPFSLSGLRRPLLFTLALLIPYAIEVSILNDSRYALPITALVACVVCIGNYLHVENRRKTNELIASQGELRRLAQVAERERIGRDLHDLLGHTLSLIALKAELAGKLMERDPPAAGRELAEMQQVAREALKQVRMAVSGIRAMGLEGELASARALLESSNVNFSCRYTPGVLAPEIEVAMAMILREAITNIHRHAEATHARVEIQVTEDYAALIVNDNGKGGIIARGNGLTGIVERTRVIGGSFDIESPLGGGTTLHARFSGTRSL